MGNFNRLSVDKGMIFIDERLLSINSPCALGVKVILYVVLGVKVVSSSVGLADPIWGFVFRVRHPFKVLGRICGHQAVVECVRSVSRGILVLAVGSSGFWLGFLMSCLP